jgi:S1-C subfamily serine protease
MWLKIESGDDRGRTVEIIDRQFLIGRDDDCGLTLDDERISRQHARIETLETGGMVIRDLGATNGTYVNGTKITEPVVLEGGETIRVGRVEMSVSRKEPVPLTAFDPGTRIEAAAAASAGAAAGAAAPPAAPTASTIERAELRKSVKRSTLIAGIASGLVAILAIVLVVVLATGGFSGNDQKSVADIVKGAENSTAVVSTAIGSTDLGRGTGWVADAKTGLIVTNYHVVDSGTVFTVTIGGKQHTARLVAAAPCSDLAMLQIENSDGLESLPLGSQSSLNEGDSVVALGFPGNSAVGSPTLQATKGIVSAVNTRYNQDPSDHLYPNLVQTDAAINHGNSGGPLLDSNGKLVGVNTLASDAAENQGYAIGVDLVKPMVSAFRKGDSPAWTGLGLGYYLDAQTRTRLAQKLGFKSPNDGLLVLSQVPGSNAHSALNGEPALLVAIGDTPVYDMASYCKALNGNHTGDNEDYTFMVSGSKQPVTTTIASN